LSRLMLGVSEEENGARRKRFTCGGASDLPSMQHSL